MPKPCLEVIFFHSLGSEYILVLEYMLLCLGQNFEIAYRTIEPAYDINAVANIDGHHTSFFALKFFNYIVIETRFSIGNNRICLKILIDKKKSLFTLNPHYHVVSTP